MRRFVGGVVVLGLVIVVAFTFTTIGCNPSDGTDNGLVTKRRESTERETLNTTVEKVSEQEAKEAKSQLDKAIVAHGGENLAHLRNYELRQHGTVVTQAASPSEREGQFSFPDRCHFGYRIEQAPMDIGVDGNSAWRRTFGAGTQDLVGGELEEARTELYLYWVLTLRPLRNEEFVLKPLPDTSVMSHPAKGVKVMQKDRVQIELYFDAATNLLARVFLRPKQGGKVTEQEIIFSDYKTFEGIKLPTVWSERRGGLKAMDFSDTDYRFPSEIPAKVFAKPAE
jgi:hypothetical protein